MKATIMVTVALLRSLAVNATPYGPYETYLVDQCRVFDSRYAVGMLPASSTTEVYLRGSNLPLWQGGPDDCGVPSWAPAVLLNVIAVNPSGPGHMLVFEGGSPLPQKASTLNYSLGQNVANNVAVIACTGQSCAGDVDIYTAASTHVVIDVVGYLLPAPTMTGRVIAYGPTSFTLECDGGAPIEVVPQSGLYGMNTSLLAGHCLTVTGSWQGKNLLHIKTQPLDGGSCPGL